MGSLIAKHTSSKFAILSDNKITLIGQFIWDKECTTQIILTRKYSSGAERTNPSPKLQLLRPYAGDTTNNSTGRFYHSGDMNKDSDHYKENYFKQIV